MKWILIIVGAILFLLGGVWVLQGTHVLTQGVMAGDMKWTYIGGILAVAGVALVVIGALRRKKIRSA
jgi:uncharacterized membrane protein YdcZ (DUF606 family)